MSQDDEDRESHEEQESQSDSGDGGSEEMSEVEKSTTRADPPPTLLEWGVRAVSLALLLTLIGYVTWTAFQPDVEPQFRYEIKNAEIAQRDGAWVVPTTITNIGTATLSDLAVGLQLMKGETVVEESTVTHPLVGQKESKDAEYWFSEDPRDYELRFDVVGYRLP